MTIVAEATRMATPTFGAPVIEGELVPIDLDALQISTPTDAPIDRAIGPAKPQFRVNWHMVLVGTGTALVLSIAGLVVYEVVQLVLAIVRAVEEFGHWLHVNGPSILGVGALVLLVLIFCGGGVATCAGIHCGGCKG